MVGAVLHFSPHSIRSPVLSHKNPKQYPSRWSKHALPRTDGRAKLLPVEEMDHKVARQPTYRIVTLAVLSRKRILLMGMGPMFLELERMTLVGTAWGTAHSQTAP